MVTADWMLFGTGLVFLGLPALWFSFFIVENWPSNGWGKRVLTVCGALCVIATTVWLSWTMTSRSVDCRNDPSSSACAPTVP
jgi:hypothetical protein